MPIDSMDPECIELCDAMNRLPGIETTDSCCGHNETEFRIWFVVTDFEKKGLLLLSRLLSPNYHGFWHTWSVLLDHRDVHPQVCFILEGGMGQATYDSAETLAHMINQHVDDEVPYYNILLDERY